MYSIQTRRVVIAAIVAAAACGGTGTSSGGSTSAAPSPRRDRAVITSEEMVSSQTNNLYDVVQRLHPEWLSGRSAGTISGAAATPVQVFLDTQRAGGPEILKQMAINSAASLHYYSASESQARFGNGNVNGVIQVQTVKRP